jgi:hypothetical protein
MFFNSIFEEVRRKKISRFSGRGGEEYLKDIPNKDR